MRLYHFTSRHCLEPILREGITKGLTPYQHGGKIAYLPGTQWLTREPSFRQFWNEGVNRNRFDRTAWRLEVRIPRKHRDQLLRLEVWRDFLKGSMVEGFDTAGDPENWLIYRGKISRDWIIGMEPKPESAQLRTAGRPENATGWPAAQLVLVG